MKRKEILTKELELFNDGYGVKEIALLVNKSVLSVKINLYRYLKKGYSSLLVK